MCTMIAAWIFAREKGTASVHANMDRLEQTHFLTFAQANLMARHRDGVSGFFTQFSFD
jgi:hypothetical protein